MARLASQAQKGYFKTPPHLVPLMAQYLKTLSDAENVRVLDPCAGTGEALALLGDALDLERKQLYANELDETRFKECESFGVNAACGDAIDDLYATSWRFGLLYLNPPYDDEGNLEGRTEGKFLKHCLRFLCSNGILIYVVPEIVLAKQEIAKLLPVALKDIAVFRFPGEDYKPFKQVVLIGRKMRGESRMFVDQYNMAVSSPMTLGDVGPTYVVPGTGRTAPEFFSHNLTPEQISKYASAPHAVKLMEAGMTGEVETKVQTLMPLRAGHQALMLASGMMDGAYTAPDSGNVWVISGKTEMVKTETEASYEDKTVTTVRHTPTPVVKVLDLTESQAEGELVLFDLQ